MDDTTYLAPVVRGLWSKNPSGWTDRAEHVRTIPRWLGWLESPRRMHGCVDELGAFAEEVRRAGYTNALLLGMGGSSLAPEVICCTFGVAPGYLDLDVLDTSDPTDVLAAQRDLQPGKTLFIVSSKSGSTIETGSLLRYFYEHIERAAGARAGQDFIAITDPGSALEDQARRLGFRRTFLNPPDVGGRFSALTHVGLVPAALLGVDLERVLHCAGLAADTCRPETPIDQNLGALLGATLATNVAEGRDKITLVCPPPFTTLGCWIEQLMAESTGKEGTGVVPIEGETLGLPEAYASDRVFVTLGDGDLSAPSLFALGDAGHPVVHLPDGQRCDLGYQFFLWEFATAIAGALMNVNPFDQPNVQESKAHTDHVLATFERTGELPQVDESRQGDEAVARLLAQAGVGDYFAIMAYLPWSKAIEDALTEVRLFVRDRMKLATTVGFGPRFLHSTGQLHKGGPDNGLFLQLVYDPEEDAEIPGAGYSFGTLQAAQAIGDFQALRARHRRVARVRLSGDLPAAIRRLIPRS